MNLFLDKNTNDLVIENYNLKLVKGGDEIVQRVRVKLRFFQGEWFLDTSHGVPYFQSLLGKKNIDFGDALTILDEAVLEVEGIKEIISSSLDYDANQRKVFYTFKAQSINNTQNLGETITI